MQHVVAEVAQQHRVVAGHTEHVAERVRGTHQHVDLLAVGDDRRRRVRGDGDAVGVRQFRQQRLRQADLRQQVGLAHRVLGCGQQRERKQVDRVDVRGAVDVDLDLLRQRVDGTRQPGWLLILGYGAAVPVRGALREHLAEANRFAEVHHHLAIVGAQHLGDTGQQRPDRFLVLGLARQLVEIAGAFHQLLVADVDGLKKNRPGRLAQEAAHRHRHHAALRRQQSAGARAPALDEVLDRMAARYQLRHILAEHRRIQRAAADAAADEKRAALAQHRADHRQIEIDAGDDVRWHDAARVQQVAQQQVVHVAAVAGHVDDLKTGGILLEPVEVVHQHAAVDAVPHRGEDEAERAHHRVRIVGGNLVGAGVRLLPRVGAALVGLAAAVAAGLVGDGLLDRLRRQHPVDQQTPGRQVRPDHRRADAVEVGTQHARQLAHGAFGRQALVDDAAQRHRRRKPHQRVTAVEQDREQSAEAADQGPVFREQHREPAAAAVRRAADENRHRHQLHIQRRIGAVRVEQPRQRTRVGLGRRRAIAQRLQRPERVDVAARQRDIGTLAAERVAG